MSENKNARTSADGPEYERGFVDGMQRQMQLHVNRVIKEEPVAFCNGMPAYEGLLSKAQRLTQDLEAPLTINGVPLYPKTEWVSLTDEEIQDLSYLSQKIDESNAAWFDRWGFARAVEAKLKGKNHG
jgi:hypothetical protein